MQIQILRPWKRTVCFGSGFGKHQIKCLGGLETISVYMFFSSAAFKNKNI
jgi:hypothetical protein